MFTQTVRGFPLLLLIFSNFVSAQIPSSGCTSTTTANQICGQTGGNPTYAQPGNPVFAYQTLNSVTECQNLCLRRADSGAASCESFSYDSSTSLCTITPSTLASISEEINSSIAFYERACFACPQPCDQQAVGQDLLDNSGFDISPKYLGPWFSSGSNAQGIQKGGRKSNGSYFCTEGGANKCTIQQSFYNCPSTVYKWSYDYKAVYKKSSSFYATASYSGGAKHSLSYPSNNAATLKWQTYTDLFQVNSNITSTTMNFNLQPAKSGQTFIVDNIKLQPTKYIVGPEPDAHNSLPAGGFEQGTLAPWTKTQKGENLTIVSPGFVGKYALKWTIKSGQSNPTFGIMQDFTNKNLVCEPGKAYLFNLDQQNNLPRGGGVVPVLFAKLEVFTGDSRVNETNVHNVYTQYHYGGSGSIRLPFQGQVNQNFVRITISVISEVPKGNYYITVDNFSFKPLAVASSSTS